MLEIIVKHRAVKLRWYKHCKKNRKIYGKQTAAVIAEFYRKKYGKNFRF